MSEMSYSEAAKAMHGIRHFFRALSSMEAALAAAANAEADVAAAKDERAKLEAKIASLKASYEDASSLTTKAVAQYEEAVDRMENFKASHRERLLEAEAEYDAKIAELEASEKKRLAAAEAHFEAVVAQRTAVLNGIEEKIAAALERQSRAEAALTNLRNKMSKIVGDG